MYMHSPDFQALLDRLEALEKRVNKLEGKEDKPTSDDVEEDLVQ
jgi:hypothetical protein